MVFLKEREKVAEAVKFRLGGVNPWIVGGVAGVGLLTLIIGIRQFLSAAPPSQPNNQAAMTAAQPIKITALGRLEPQGEVITISGAQGDRIGQLLVEEGEQVKKGQVLLYLDTYPERLAERNLAADQLQEAQARLAAETQLGEAQIAEAQSRVSQVSEPKLAEIQAQEATIKRLQAELEAKQREYQRFLQLQQSGAVSLQDMEDRAILVETSQEELRTAQANLMRLKNQKRTDTVNAEDQLRSAQANLTRSQAQILVNSAASNLKLAEARLQRTIMRAPQDGQILKIFSRAGEAIGDDGILQLGNTSQMYAVAEVYETDVPRVKVGQPATITSPALKQPIPGQVSYVGLLIAKNDVLDTDPAAKTDIRVVEVKIRLENSQAVAGLTNLQVEVAIEPQG